MVEEIYDICEQIGGFCDANGWFQGHVAFDLRARDVESMTVAELAAAIEIARVRYNRLFDGVRLRSFCDLSEEDRQWLEAYSNEGAEQ